MTVDEAIAYLQQAKNEFGGDARVRRRVGEANLQELGINDYAFVLPDSTVEIFKPEKA